MQHVNHHGETRFSKDSIKRAWYLIRENSLPLNRRIASFSRVNNSPCKTEIAVKEIRDVTAAGQRSKAQRFDDIFFFSAYFYFYSFFLFSLFLFLFFILFSFFPWLSSLSLFTTFSHFLLFSSFHLTQLFLTFFFPF